MFKIDTRDIKELESHLKAFADRAYPFATKNTLNRSGFEAQKIARKDVRIKMVTRNKFTEKSVLVVPTKTLKVSRQATRVGSTADYMEDQEFGATQHKTGSEGVAIPTSWSASQEGQQPRTRLPRRINKLQNIRLKHRRRKGSNKKQQLLITVREAMKSGNRFFFWQFGRRKGIFKVLGGRNNPNKGWPKGARLKMVYDMTEQSIVIPRNPWLKPAVDRVQVLMPGFYRDSLIFQLKRQGLFKGK